MANQNDNFIDEVFDDLRRERLFRLFRRWGWVIGVIVLAIIGTAAFLEWREARAEAAAEQRGEAILSALEVQNPEERLAALSALPAEGGEGAVAAFLLAAEQQGAGDPQAAVATLSSLAANGDVVPLYRDLAALKAQMTLGAEADPAALEALAAPGAPFRLLAQEQLALVQLQSGQTDEAVATFQAILQDAEVSPAQGGRIGALMTALGRPPEEQAAPQPEAEVPAPIGE